MKRFAPLIALCTLAATAAAEPYWYAYEGNDFPENEGWHYTTTEPAAQRWLEDGSLFVDNRADADTRDSYGRVPESGWALDAGETFIMRWRYRVEDVQGWKSPGVWITSDEQYAVAFVASETDLKSVYENDTSVTFEPEISHDFELRSSDMRSYSLFLDGELALTGAFAESLFSAEVFWGDLSSAGSLVAWDYVAVGVVPEPVSLAILMAAYALWRCSR